MYDNPFDLCDCPIFNCDCGGGVQSYLPHYRRVLAIVGPQRVFEWGPGENTRMALRAGAEVFAVEPMLKWVAPLPTDDPRMAVLVTPTESPSYLNLHGREDSDLFFVDSRRRAECLDLVRERARPEAVVCLHDAQRKRYNPALQRFAHVVFLARWFAVASMRPLPTELLRDSSLARAPVRSTPGASKATFPPDPSATVAPVDHQTTGTFQLNVSTTEEIAVRRDEDSADETAWASRASGAPKVLFASYHCYLDPSSGAAGSTRDMLEMLAARSWTTRVLCGPRLDHESGESPRQLAIDLGAALSEKRFEQGGNPFSILHYVQAKVPVSIYEPDRRGEPTEQEIADFMAVYERLLETSRPDVLVTYGGQWVGQRLIRAARRRGIRVVFSLRNFAYKGARLFDQANAILVPSQFSAEHYRRRLGLECTPVPSPIIWSRAKCEPDPTRRFVTFVNPQLAKGVTVFARIAAELGHRRPDIPLLVVEGRGGTDQLRNLEIDLDGLTNLHWMANTPDPRDFYRVSKVLLMPSLWPESFGRVAVEAMLNGIPFLCSDRGALPETVGRGGFTLAVPAKYTPRSRQIPSADEVAPWTETIERLWDDDAFYQESSDRARTVAEMFREERISDQYAAFFRRVAGLADGAETGDTARRVTAKRVTARQADE